MSETTTKSSSEKAYTQKGTLGEIIDFPNKKKEVEAFEKFATDKTKEVWTKIQKDFPEAAEKIELIAGEKGANGKPYAIIKAVAPFTTKGKEGSRGRNLLAEMTGLTLLNALEKNLFNAKDAPEKTESYIKGPFKEVPAKEGETKRGISIVSAKYIETIEERKAFLDRQKESKAKTEEKTAEAKPAPEAKKAAPKKARTTKKKETAKEAADLF